MKSLLCPEQQFEALALSWRDAKKSLTFPKNSFSF